jgi:hypothetical protein
VHLCRWGVAELTRSSLCRTDTVTGAQTKPRVNTGHGGESKRVSAGGALCHCEICLTLRIVQIREKNRLGFINSAIVYSYYPTGRVSEIWEDWMLNPQSYNTAQCCLTLPLSFQGWDWALTIWMLQKHKYHIQKKIITNPKTAISDLHVFKTDPILCEV